ALLFTLVARHRELGSVPRRWVHEPTPAARVVVKPEGVAGGSPDRRPTEIGDANVDITQNRDVLAGTGPATHGILQQWAHLSGSEVATVMSRGRRRQLVAVGQAQREDRASCWDGGWVGDER